MLISFWLGFELSIIMTNLAPYLLTRLAIGWLIGSLFTGIVFFITSFLIPMCFIHSLIIYLLELILCYYFYSKRKTMRFPFRSTPFLNAFLLFTIGVSLKCLSSTYKNIPYSAPRSFGKVLDL